MPQPSNEEQAAFERWLSRTCPSGDATSVQEQWLASSDYADLCDEAADEAYAIRQQHRADVAYGIARVTDQPSYERIEWQAVGAVFAWHSRKALGLETADVCPFKDPFPEHRPDDHPMCEELR